MSSEGSLGPDLSTFPYTTQTMSKVPLRRTLGHCQSPFHKGHRDIKPKPPFSQSPQSVHEWPTETGVPWPNHCHFQQGTSGSHPTSGQYISLYLDTGVTFTVLTKSCYLSIVRVRGPPYQANQTPPLSCIFGGVPFVYSSLVLPTCPLSLVGKGAPNQIGSLYFLCSLHLVNPRLTSHSPPPNLTFWYYFFSTIFSSRSPGVKRPKPFFYSQTSPPYHETTNPDKICN